MISPKELMMLGAEGVLPDTLVDLAPYAWSISMRLVMKGSSRVDSEGSRNFFTTIRYDSTVYRLERKEEDDIITVKGVRLDGASGEALIPLIPLTLSQTGNPTTEDETFLPLSPVPVGIVAQELLQGIRVPDAEYDNSMLNLQKSAA